MTQLTIDQLDSDAYAAGFTGTSLNDIVAIALAESGGRTDATNTTGNSAGVDRGVLQINSYYHPEVSDAQAFDPLQAFKAAWNISDNGTNFTPWSTFDSGAYKQYLQNNVSGAPPDVPNFLPSCKDSPGQWYCSGEGETYGQSYNGSVEHGNDLDETFHTPITALYGGTVTDASYHPWGGQVGILTNIPGYGSVVEYVQHLDDISSTVRVGSTVNAGDILGLSGGQLGYGDHPNDPTYSTGPHVEFGFNAPWVNGLSQASNQSSFNSQFAIDAARSGKQSGSAGNTSNSGNKSNIVDCSGKDPLATILCVLTSGNVAGPGTSSSGGFDWKNGAIRTGLIVVGVLLAVLGLVKFVS